MHGEDTTPIKPGAVIAETARQTIPAGVNPARELIGTTERASQRH
jgi:hypothetical protein